MYALQKLELVNSHIHVYLVSYKSLCSCVTDVSLAVFKIVFKTIVYIFVYYNIHWASYISYAYICTIYPLEYE